MLADRRRTWEIVRPDPARSAPFCKVATGADMVFHAPNGPERFGKHMRTWLSW